MNIFKKHNFSKGKELKSTYFALTLPIDDQSEHGNMLYTYVRCDNTKQFIESMTNILHRLFT